MNENDIHNLIEQEDLESKCRIIKKVLNCLQNINMPSGYIGLNGLHTEDKTELKICGEKNRKNN